MSLRTGDLTVNKLKIANVNDKLGFIGSALDEAEDRFSAVEGPAAANTIYGAPDGVPGPAAFRFLVSTDIPSLDAAKITTGLLALARGGTNTDLSGTGGTNKILKQKTAGGTISVETLAASELSNGVTGSGKVVLQTAPTITGTITLDSGVKIVVGSGSPESAVTAPVGSVYHRTDGGAGTSFYVKESGTGSTGWVGK